MRVLVIGGGWFGCETANILHEKNIDFDILDKTNGFFNGSSSRNQNRLHFGGFHYCRSYSTRKECRTGYDRFISSNPGISEEVDSIYIVAKNSVLDFETYIAIFEHEKSPFQKVTLSEIERRGMCMNKHMVDGDHVIIVKEHWINFKKAKEIFEKKYQHKLLEYDSKKLILGDMKYGEKKYTHIFDATYGQLIPFKNSFFEACITLIYKKTSETDDGKMGVTIVDGEFFSLYPYKPDENLFTLTHVKLTPMFKSTKIDEVNRYIASLTHSDINDRRYLIENNVSQFHTNLLNSYKYENFFISTKTKFNCNGCDDRSTRIQSKNNIMSFCGGKITGACDIKKDVLEFLKL